MIATILSATVGLATLAFGIWKWFNRAPTPAQEIANADASRQATEAQVNRDSDAAIDEQLHEFDRH